MTNENGHPWGQNKGFRQVGRIELPGAGQVVVEGNYAYVAHMQPPLGTTILDISDPTHPHIVTQIPIAPIPIRCVCMVTSCW